MSTEELFLQNMLHLEALRLCVMSSEIDYGSRCNWDMVDSQVSISSLRVSRFCFTSLVLYLFWTLTREKSIFCVFASLFVQD